MTLLVNGTQIYHTLKTEFPFRPLPPLSSHSVNTEYPELNLLAASAFALLLFGHYLRMHAIHHLGRQFTFTLSLKNEHKLVTDGPYSIVRHPSYLGAILYCVGNVVFVMGPGSVWFEHRLWLHPVGALAVLSWVALNLSIMTLMVWRTTDEDAALRGEFGEQWDLWAKKTPYKLFPFIF